MAIGDKFRFAFCSPDERTDLARHITGKIVDFFGDLPRKVLLARRGHVTHPLFPPRFAASTETRCHVPPGSLAHCDRRGSQAFPLSAERSMEFPEMLAVILPVLGGYVISSVVLLHFPRLLHRKKQVAFRCQHISHRGGEFP